MTLSDFFTLPPPRDLSRAPESVRRVARQHLLAPRLIDGITLSITVSITLMVDEPVVAFLSFALIMWLPFYLLLTRRLRRDATSLFTTGRTAPAMITSAHPTSWHYKGRTWRGVDLILSVMPPDAAPTECWMRLTTSKPDAAAFQVGSRMTVVLDAGVPRWLLLDDQLLQLNAGLAQPLVV